MRKHRPQRPRSERGAAAVEFALVMLPLLLIVGGIINFGVVFAQQLALDNAARQGARWGAVDGRTSSQINAEMQSALGTMINKTGTVSITITRTDGATSTTIPAGSTQPCKDSTFGQNVKVETSYSSKVLFPWIVPGIPSTFSLKGSGEFQCEFS